MHRTRLSDIAKAAGVSLTTVSRAMNNNGYVADDVRRRIQLAADQLGYTHPKHKIKANVKKIIGIISTQGSLNPFFSILTEKLQKYAAQEDYYCVCVSSDRLDNETLYYHVEQLAQIGVCSLIITSFLGKELNDDTRFLLNSLNIPVVFLERTGGCHGFNRILVDNVIGTFAAADYLIKAGHRRLAYLAYTSKASVEQKRAEGFIKAFEHLSDPAIKYHIVPCPEITPTAAAAAMQSILAHDPQITGVVAWNDVLASGALNVFLQLGKKVPDEAAIIGYDDILAPLLVPPLSSVKMPLDEIAEAGIEIIDKFLNLKTPPSSRTVTFEPTLIIRK